MIRRWLIAPPPVRHRRSRPAVSSQAADAGHLSRIEQDNPYAADVRQALIEALIHADRALAFEAPISFRRAPQPSSARAAPSPIWDPPPESRDADAHRRHRSRARGPARAPRRAGRSRREREARPRPRGARSAARGQAPRRAALVGQRSRTRAQRGGRRLPGHPPPLAQRPAPRSLIGSPTAPIPRPRPPDDDGREGTDIRTTRRVEQAAGPSTKLIVTPVRDPSGFLTP